MDEKALYNTGIREGKELGRAEGEKIGRATGKEEGKHENKIEVIKRMLNANLSIDLIKECTKATDEEIEEAKISKK